MGGRGFPAASVVMPPPAVDEDASPPPLPPPVLLLSCTPDPEPEEPMLVLRAEPLVRLVLFLPRHLSRWGA
jgi:hypothetical protein